MLSKESCLLFFPLLIIFSSNKTRWTVPGSIAISLILYFCLKYWIDSLSATAAQASLEEAFDTINTIKISLLKLVSAKGLADIFSVYGFFSLLFITGLLYKNFRVKIKTSFNGLFLVFAATIFAHMLLSSELARMFYLGSAMFVPFLAKCFELHPLFEKLPSGNV
jgi:hypothetical protein